MFSIQCAMVWQFTLRTEASLKKCVVISSEYAVSLKGSSVLVEDHLLSNYR